MKVGCGCVVAILMVGTVDVSGAASPTIFRCTSHGETIYSDRPCAPDAVVHESDIDRVTLYTPPPISEHAFRSPSGPASNKPAKPTKRHKDPGAAQAKHRAACAKLAQSSRDVRNKLRTGYGVKEGEQLKERQRSLAERQRAEKCG